MNINLFGEDISLSIPAVIERFEEKEDDDKEELEIDSAIHGTRAKLKIFFIGKTEDKRVFTKQFAENLLETLPGTPIVAYYDEDKEDFIGHNKVQYIYGYVPSDCTSEFKSLDGKQWAVTDLILFTERKDNIGEVAKKIIGKPQSLELNPDTVEYDVSFNSKGKINEIKFNKGSFYGLSVLADDQKPAFKNSGFFSEEEFIEKFGSVIDRIKNCGGFKKMDEKELKGYDNFLALSSNQKMNLLSDALYEKFGYSCYIIDLYMDSNEVIIRDYKGIQEDVIGYYKISFTELTEEGENGTNVKFEFGSPIRVYPTYAEFIEDDNKDDDVDDKDDDVDDVNDKDDDVDDKEDKEDFVKSEEDDKANCAKEDDDDKANCAKEDDDDKANCAKEDEDKSKCAKEDEDKSKCAKEDEDKSKCAKEDEKTKCSELEETPEVNAFKQEEDANDKEGVSENDEKPSTNQENFNSTSLSGEERAELEKFRQEKKENLINSYKDLIDKELLKPFEEKIAEYSYEDLEKELALVFAKNYKNNRLNTIQGFINIQEEKDKTTSIQDLVETYK